MESPITRLLADWRQGDEHARDALIARLYPELRRLAGAQFRRERADHTLQPTALLHEAWLRLSGSERIDLADRRQLLGTVAHLMRQVLVDHARARAAAKRDGGQRVTLQMVDLVQAAAPAVDLLELDQALTRLQALDETKARIVELRYFEGLNISDTAAVLGSSPATVKRHWQAARAWLFATLADGAPPPGAP